MKSILRLLAFFINLLLLSLPGKTQMVTGVWKGKINRQKAEVKIIQQGDSLTGTSYYYDSPTQYRRYSIKGYFDAQTNETVWWDDQLIEEKPARAGGVGRMALLSRADFNCPGDGRMMLDGKTGKKMEEDPRGDLHLDKIDSGIFPDEWDFVINNYTLGASDPYVIDSIGAIAFQQPSPPISRDPAPLRPAPINPKESPTIAAPAPESPTPKIITPIVDAPSIEEKFVSRKKVLVSEIPLTGDSIELRFYDNAEIDGDSISLFLNDRLIFQHIRLLGSAYTIKLPVAALNETNELTMVAENLGSIPPNTSFMVALVGEKRYEARLESTEGSSAMIRLVKKR